MRKVILLVMISALLLLPLLGGQKDDPSVGYTKDYIDAMQKKAGTDRINALKAYVKKYPDTTKQFTKLAYYWLALDYFQLKNYAEAIKLGEKTLKIGMGDRIGEEARLTLVLANAYGIKSTPNFDQPKALSYAKKASELGKKAQDAQVTKTAQTLIKQLSAPPKPNLTPEQKLKRAYSLEDYDEVVRIYKGMSAADKGNSELHELYANALLKSNQTDGALREFSSLYAKEKKGKTARRIADIYEQKGKRNKALLSKAIDFYLEAGWLYQKEGESSRTKAVFHRAQYLLFEKYDFNKKALTLQKKSKASASQAEKNRAEILKLKREVRKVKKEIRGYERMDSAAPPYLEEKLGNLNKKINDLKSGRSAESTDEAGKLEEERARILKEFEALKGKAKQRLGL